MRPIFVHVNIPVVRDHAP